MRFTKMHGLGNDYVYVNCFDQQVLQPAQLARVVSDRHRGNRLRWPHPYNALRHRRRPHANVQRRRLRSPDVRQRHPLPR